MDFPCMAKLRVSECTRTCRRFDSSGNLIDLWEESRVEERHIGCCNICVMTTPLEVSGNMPEKPPRLDSCLPRMISGFTPIVQPIRQEQVIRLVRAEPIFQLVSTEAASAVSSQDCDTVVHADCFYEPWRNTGVEWCGFSWACTLSLPPFSAHFIEQERTHTCRYRCANGTQYTQTYYQRRDLRVGCCGGGIILRSRPKPNLDETLPYYH